VVFDQAFSQTLLQPGSLTPMASSFGWLDYDEASRQRMRELVGLFQEPGSIDELGLGRIRDAFSDRFFPGTSVLWRRARYLFFVPWVYGEIEEHGFQRHSDARSAARALPAQSA